MRALIRTHASSIALTLLALTSLLTTQAYAEKKPIDLSAYKGKVVYVDFWASWCGPCKQSFPWLNSLSSKAESGLVVIGVNLDEKKADADAFLADFPANFEILFDPAADYASYYDILGMPSSIIFDRNGNKVHQHAAFKLDGIAEYEATIESVLNLPYEQK